MSRKNYFILLLLIFVGGVGQVLAQSGTISGTVTSAEDGEPIIGVAVVFRSTGVITGVNGDYTLHVPADVGELTFSYLGFETVTVHVGSKTVVDVVMVASKIIMDEVVVVGYGSQKKVSVTGAVASVTSEHLKQTPSTNLAGALAGRMSGLSVMQPSGQPGYEEFEIRLRGASTINGQDPLVLVDGVPRDNLSMVDPNEVESMSILKDASATAVFGVRGANGVILITTKTGSIGKPTLTVSAEYGLQSFNADYATADSWDHARLENEAARMDGRAEPIYTERQIQLYKDGTNPLYPNTDWFDVMYNSVAPVSRYNANLSGSTERVKYFVNVGMVNQGGMMNTMSSDDLGYDPQFKLNRYNFRTNLDIKANKWLDVGLKLSGYIDKINRPLHAIFNQYVFFKEMYLMDPTVPFGIDPSFEQYGVQTGVDAFLANDTSVGNPYAALNYRGYEEKDRGVFNNSASLNANLDMITKGLSARVMVSYDVTTESIITGTRAAPFYNMYQFSIKEEIDADGNVLDVPNFATNNDIRNIYKLTTNKKFSSRYALNLQGMLNYERAFGKNTVGGMLVYQVDNHQQGSVANGSISLLPRNRINYAARVTYRYDDRYMAEFNVGYNGSEQFAEGMRFGTFPAGSVGWLASNEEFLKDNDVITSLKLRASYGKVGNDRVSDVRFLYLDNNEIRGGGPIGSLGNGQTIIEKLIGNPYLTWEIAYKQNYGVDLELFDDLTVTVDYFREFRDNILIERKTVPSVLGNLSSTIPKENKGQIKNHGFEVAVNYRKRFDSGFAFNIRGAVDYAKNEILFLDELSAGEDFYYPYRKHGFSMGQQFGYHIDWNSPGNGYFLDQEEIDEYASYNVGAKPRPGDFVYKDYNEDGVIDTKDEAPIGSPSLPIWNYNFNINLEYKGINLSLLFIGIGNSHTLYNGNGVYESQSGYQNHHYNAWTPERHESGAEISAPALSLMKGSSQIGNDFYIVNRKFLRLKNVEVGYKFPKKMTEKIGMSNLRVYMNCNNLWTWHDMRYDFIDPEQNTTQDVLPLQRIVNVGITASF